MKTFLKRLKNYLLHGIPTQVVQTTQAEVVSLASNELLRGRKALVTGGTSGIGYAITSAFLNAGASVVITGRDQSRIDKAIASLKGQHPEALVSGIVLDNTQVDETTARLQALLAQHDIDLLVNNAGILGGVLSKCTEEKYDAVMDTNLKGAVFITRIISQHMIDKGIKGNILNICSSSSLRPADTAYVLSKWGLRGYTLGLAKSLIQHGIVVNGLAPGPTATPMQLQGDNPNLYLPNNPSQRYALPEEIANMAVVLTSGLGKLVVGDIVYITGGAGVITFDDIKY